MRTRNKILSWSKVRFQFKRKDLLAEMILSMIPIAIVKDRQVLCEKKTYYNFINTRDTDISFINKTNKKFSHVK